METAEPEPSGLAEPPSTGSTGGFTIHDYAVAPEGHRRLRRLPHLLRVAIAIVWRAAPREFLVCAVLQTISGAALAAQLLVIRSLLQSLIGGDQFSEVMPGVVTLAVIGGALAFSGVVLEGLQRILGAKVGLYTASRLIESASAVDLLAYEYPMFHDRLQRAQLSSQVRPTQLANGLLGLGGALFALAGIGVALLLVQPLFFALIMVGFAPAWVASLRAGRMIYEFSKEQTERDRKRQYLFGVLTRKEEAQEVRAFDLAGFLGDRHDDLYLAMLDDLRRVVRRRRRTAALGQFSSALVTSAAIGLLVWLLTTDRISLAAAGSAVGAMVLLASRLKDLASAAAGLYEGSLYLEDYSSFVDATPKLMAGRPTEPAPAVAVVAADRVGFTYPSRVVPSLVDASLSLCKGEVVALVGENGSGKTTFAKLLAGLYAPNEGSVTWDGLSTSAIDPASGRQKVAVIFQDFIRWQLSVRDNIALGDAAHYDDEDAVIRAATAAGIHDRILELDHGYDTLLGPQFYGGSNISGGEWQRIALARAFFRDAPLVILDEPTAALDPRAEAALYDSMGEMFSDRAVLLISHRFGSVRSANVIYVLDKGRVVESGNHEELMARNGYYAELFQLQAHRYRE